MAGEVAGEAGGGTAADTAVCSGERETDADGASRTGQAGTGKGKGLSWGWVLEKGLSLDCDMHKFANTVSRKTTPRLNFI